MDGLEILPIVRESSTLSDRCFIVDFPNSLHESVVKGHLSQHNALLLGLFGLVACLKADLLHPPVVKCGHGYGRKIIPLKGIFKFWSGVWQPLYKREEVYAGFALAQASQQWF